MIRKVMVILLVMLLLLVAVAPVSAGGDKVHGDKAQGPSEAHGECPYGGEGAGDNNAGAGPFN